MNDSWMREDSITNQVSSRPQSQYLCFWLGSQTYALPVGQVHEIRAVGAWSRLPGTPPWVLGVMNLRGLAIPLYDLRLRFEVTETTQASSPVMIIVGARGRLGGVIVDGVLDVTEIEDGALRSSDAGEDGSGPVAVKAVATWNDTVVIVLDGEALMASPVGGRWTAGETAQKYGRETDQGRVTDDVALVQ